MSVCCSVPLGRSVVTHFGVAEENFGEEGGRAIARMLELNSSITRLYLSCKFGPEDARAISSALERNSTLKSLHFPRESALAALNAAAGVCGHAVVRVR
jgi:hypothetical protein